MNFFTANNYMMCYVLVSSFLNLIIWLIFFIKNHDKESYGWCVALCIAGNIIVFPFFLLAAFWEIIKKIFRIKSDLHGIGSGYDYF